MNIGEKMVILIFINIAIIIYIFLKYYRFPENKNSTIEKIEDRDVMLIGYINDGEFRNSFDLILAEIVELNVKGYIKIEYSKEIIDKYNYIIKQNINIGSDKLNKYEMLVMNFLFFNKTEITRAELEEKLRNTFHSYNVQFNEIESVLNNQLVIEGIIDAGKQQELAKRKKWYVKISIIFILLVSILGIFNIIENSLLYMLIFSIFLLLFFLKNSWNLELYPKFHIFYHFQVKSNQNFHNLIFLIIHSNLNN